MKSDPDYDRAEKAAREKCYDEAIAIYRELIERHPEEDSLKMSLAWVFRDSGKTDEAIELLLVIFKKELARDVFTGFAFDELVRLFREKADFAGLTGVCEEAVSVWPHDKSLLFTLGEAYRGAERFSDAARVFEKLAAREPDAPEYFSRLGNVLATAGEFERAEKAYEKAAEIDPVGAPSYYNSLGHVLAEADEYGRAVAAYRKSIKRNGNQPLVFCHLADIYVKEGRVAEAEEAYEEAIRIDPGHKAAYYNRFGNILARTGLNGNAILIFRKAIAEDPNNPFLYVFLAQACLAEGLHEEAREAYLTATTLGADF